jgi:hypothetical protein
LKTVLSCMSVWDLDGSGYIDQKEFSQLLVALRDDAADKYRDLTTFPIMCEAEAAGAVAGTEPRAHTHTHTKYIPPVTGADLLLHMTRLL